MTFDDWAAEHPKATPRDAWNAAIRAAGKVCGDIEYAAWLHIDDDTCDCRRAKAEHHMEAALACQSQIELLQA